MNEDRLITNLTKRSFYGSAFEPYGRRPNHTPYANRAGYTAYAGYRDFPASNSFD
jgi:hypothetical protein